MEGAFPPLVYVPSQYADRMQMLNKILVILDQIALGPANVLPAEEAAASASRLRSTIMLHNNKGYIRSKRKKEKDRVSVQAAKMLFAGEKGEGGV